MFTSIGQALGSYADTLSNAVENGKKPVPAATPASFPNCTPQVHEGGRLRQPLVPLLQKIQRPPDIKSIHFEALGLHLIPDAMPEDILPDASFLPPFEEWSAMSQDDLEDATTASKKPLSNGNLSPGIQTYQERKNELSIDNAAAFRTTRRIPVPAGQNSIRLGNAYEFFKNLELVSGYWTDTSLPKETPTPETKEIEKSENRVPAHQKIYHRIGTGSQMPHEIRQHLVTAFIKLVAYDFGCNASFARCEPRLVMTPPSKPPSSFSSSTSFIYRTPTDRSAARAGIVEGPVAAVSCRSTTAFPTDAEERLDLAREIVAILLTAQQRTRETQSEKRFGEGKWWTSTPRWGGGPGGAIGREAERPSPATPDVPEAKRLSLPEKINQDIATVQKDHSRGRTALPSPSKRRNLRDGALPIYASYRKMLPPSSTWDHKARYRRIGHRAGTAWDDVFLVSSLNHHVSIVRARVPDGLLTVLRGEEGDWEKVECWRSRWFDLFLVADRVEAMQLVWGMMAWLMRAEEDGKKGGHEMHTN